MLKAISRWLFGNDQQAIIDALYPTNELSGVQIEKATGLWIQRLYPALRQLEAEGTIESRWGEQQLIRRGVAMRRLYRLTKNGRKLRIQ
jgi:hypothetical protein